MHVFSEWQDDVPTHAVITLNGKAAAHIRKMREAVNDCGAYGMESFNSSLDFKVALPEWEDPEDGSVPPLSLLADWEGRGECVVLVVTKKEFYWKGVIRHTDAHMETEPIDTKELRWLQTK